MNVKNERNTDPAGAWEKFCLSGKVADFLLYRSSQQSVGSPDRETDVRTAIENEESEEWI